MHQQNLASLFLFLLLSPAHSLFNKEDPVLWRESKIPVTSDIIDAHHEILYTSPCSLFSNATADPATVDQLRDWCERIFETDFLQPLMSFCSPVTSRPDVVLSLSRQQQVTRSPSGLLRQKRVPLLPLLLPAAVPLATAVKTGVLAIVSFFGIAAGVTTLVQQSAHGDTLDSMRRQMEERRQQTIRMREALAEMDRLQQETARRLHRLEQRVDGFINAFPSATTLVADIASRFTHTRYQLESVAHKWKAGAVDPALFDILSVNLTARMDRTRVSPLACSLDLKRSTVSLTYRIPVTDPDAVLMTADPFTLVTYPDDQTHACRFTYDGPMHVVYTPSTSCVYPLFGTHDLTGLIVYFPSHDSCTPLPDAGFSKFFTSKGCKEWRHMHTNAEITQIKTTRESNFVYCYGSSISYDHLHLSCPDYVFKLPITSNFTSGSVRYRYQSLRWQQHASSSLLRITESTPS